MNTNRKRLDNVNINSTLKEVTDIVLYNTNT